MRERRTGGRAGADTNVSKNHFTLPAKVPFALKIVMCADRLTQARSWPYGRTRERESEGVMGHPRHATRKGMERRRR